MARKLPPHAPGMEHLLQDDDKGNAPGIDLDTLFADLLRAAYERGSLTMEEARATIGLSLHNLYPRMDDLFQEPVDHGIYACLHAALGQLVLRGLLHEQNGLWLKTDNLVAGKRLEIIGTGKQAIAVKLSGEDSPASLEALQRQQRDQAAIHENARLAGQLAPGRGGLRSINPLVVEAIVQRYREQGFIDQEAFYILRDQHGRILSGHHRLVAAEVLGIEWPTLPVYVQDDAEAVAIALESNMGMPWDVERVKGQDGKWYYLPTLPKDYQGQGLGNKAKYARVCQAIIDDPGLADRGHARALGVDNKTVARARAHLEKTEDIPHYIFPGGRGVTRGILAEPNVSTAAESQENEPVRQPTAIQQEIYDYLHDHGPCSDPELDVAFKGTYAGSTVRSRRNELVKQGRVRDSGRKYYTTTRAGKNIAHTIWEVVPEHTQHNETTSPQPTDQSTWKSKDAESADSQTKGAEISKDTGPIMDNTTEVTPPRNRRTGEQTRAPLSNTTVSPTPSPEPRPTPSPQPAPPKTSVTQSEGKEKDHMTSQTTDANYLHMETAIRTWLHELQQTNPGRLVELFGETLAHPPNSATHEMFRQYGAPYVQEARTMATDLRRLANNVHILRTWADFIDSLAHEAERNGDLSRPI